MLQCSLAGRRCRQRWWRRWWSESHCSARAPSQACFPGLLKIILFNTLVLVLRQNVIRVEQASENDQFKKKKTFIYWTYEQRGIGDAILYEKQYNMGIFPSRGGGRPISTSLFRLCGPTLRPNSESPGKNGKINPPFPKHCPVFVKNCAPYFGKVCNKLMDWCIPRLSSMCEIFPAIRTILSSATKHSLKDDHNGRVDKVTFVVDHDIPVDDVDDVVGDVCDVDDIGDANDEGDLLSSCTDSLTNLLVKATTCLCWIAGCCSCTPAIGLGGWLVGNYLCKYDCWYWRMRNTSDHQEVYCVQYL